jgi:hypothetical protein
MPLRYACFISYRHYEDNELAKSVIDGVYTALKNELDFLVGPDRVHRDDHGGLPVGAKIPEMLSLNLCESACMVVIYGPDYFSQDSTWCAREFKAMLDLEEARLALLTNPLDRAQGLIVIIVFRGKDRLPEALKQNRIVRYFDSYSLYEPIIPKNPQLGPLIKEIAEYIYDRFRTLQMLPTDPTAGCATFNLPDEMTVQDWLNQLAMTPGAAIPQDHANDYPR